MFVPAYLLIRTLRESIPTLRVTEAHPKALLHALKLPVWRPKNPTFSLNDSWQHIAAHFQLSGVAPETEHERDAVLAAVAAREGLSGRWKRNLATERSEQEFVLDDLLKGPVDYFWPS